MDKRLIELRKRRDKLQKELEEVKSEIVRVKTTCEYEDTKICEFIQKRASYVCTLCKRTIMHR